MKLLLLALVCLGLVSAKEKTIIVASDSAKVEALKGWLSKTQDVEVTKDPAVTFKKYGEYQYDNLVLFGVESEIKVADVLDFVDSNHNVLVVYESAADAPPDSVLELATECGVYVSDTNVVDHFNNDGKPEKVKISKFTTSKGVFTSKMSPLVYTGLGLKAESNNPLLVPLATAGYTAYTPAPEDDDDESPGIMGTNIAIAVGLQTRQGSRITFVGSSELFAGKAEFAQATTEWTMGARGLLRHSAVQHDKVNGTHKGYRIRDYLSYSVKIEERVNGNWVPFVADDVQVEFTMMDPYVRQALSYNKKKNDGTYDIVIQAPDVYGVFKFLVDYRRPGYSLLTFSDQAVIRPLRLNEYDRFIASAYPFYAGVFACYGGFFLFVLIFLNSSDE